MKQYTILLITCVLLFVSCNGKKTKDGYSDTDTARIMMMQIQKCSRLYTAEYHLHKIITHDDKKQIKGTFLNRDFNLDLPLGKRKVAIPMDATVKAYIDFSDFSEKNIEKNGKKINIILPNPKIVIASTKIDHDNVKQYVAFTRADFSDEELTDYEKQGRRQIAESIPQLGIIETARQNSAGILVPLLTQLGYEEKDITVSFRKQFSAKDIINLIDNNIGK